MLNVFPSLLTYSMFAPFLLRVILGAYLIWRSYKTLVPSTSFENTTSVAPKLTNFSKTLEIIFLISGVLLLIGLFTQVAALVVGVLTALTLLNKKKILPLTEVMLYKFILVISISLMLTGAGIFAIDLPL